MIDIQDNDLEKSFFIFFEFIKKYIGIKSYEERINATTNFITCGERALYRDSNDLLFLYIVMCSSILNKKYELYNPIEFSRIYPAFINMITNWNTGLNIKNFDEKISALCNKNNKDTDATIFEILTAFKYYQLGFQVEIIQTTSTSKTPDLRVSKKGEIEYVECKKMRRGNDYSYDELEKWYSISSQFSDIVKEKKICGHIHFKFRSELIEINSKRVIKKVLKKLSKRDINKPFRIANNKDFKITFTPIEKNKFHVDLDPLRHLHSPSFIYYLLGSYNYRFSYKPMCEVFFEKNNPYEIGYPYVSQVGWATVLSCHSASPVASAKKAQHVKRLLVDASKQLSSSMSGAAHILIEDCQGSSVFEERYTKNVDVMKSFFDKNNGLKYLHVHYAKYITPVDAMFDVEETVQSFKRYDLIPQKFPTIWYPANEICDGCGTLLYDY